MHFGHFLGFLDILDIHGAFLSFLQFLGVHFRGFGIFIDFFDILVTLTGKFFCF